MCKRPLQNGKRFDAIHDVFKRGTPVAKPDGMIQGSIAEKVSRSITLSGTKRCLKNEKKMDGDQPVARSI